ncbi:MAG: hypothetical protein JRJ44_04055 [Deltaproteobacteria bacterium]|nr:hypothetical protein [Deltaproteobacteria bacterium]
MSSQEWMFSPGLLLGLFWIEILYFLEKREKKISIFMTFVYMFLYLTIVSAFDRYILKTLHYTSFSTDIAVMFCLSLMIIGFVKLARIYEKKKIETNNGLRRRVYYVESSF